ncbi:MAG: HAD family hydrolase [Candidatus Muirbacterium halophilum]|nr:HAD family hydrolase [Candidatus Muirbacterium halophilum]MCK9474848.1 HAD family hydrolase [Candidatus Muirbacterium halophilum]
MKYVIFDRDGTLIVEKNYLSNPDEVCLIDGVKQGLIILKNLGFEFVVITNQSGIARNYYSIDDCNKVNQRLSDILAKFNVEIKKYYICPHHPDFSGKCNCRKPETGLLEKAIEDFDIDIDNSYFVGDKCSDIICGQRKNIKSVLLMSGYGKTEINKCKADLSFENMLEFAREVERGLKS